MKAFVKEINDMEALLAEIGPVDRQAAAVVA
jgi:hypothetical protein